MDVNYDTSVDNGVDGSATYDQFKGLFICDEVNVCALKIMELLSLGKLDKGATASVAKYRSSNEMWFNQKQKKPSKYEVTDGIEDIYIFSVMALYR